LCIKCLSFSTSYPDLTKFLYSADTDERGHKGWKTGWRQGDFMDNSININIFFLWKKFTFLDILQARGIEMTSSCPTTIMTLLSSISSGNSKMACMSNFGWGKCCSDVQTCAQMEVSKDWQKENECFSLGGINDRPHIDYYWLVHVQHINALPMYVVQYVSTWAICC
jgi:hypothetical protein